MADNDDQSPSTFQPVELTGDQRLLYRALYQKDPELARKYLGALIAISQEANPERLPHAALSLRELMAALPRYLDVAMPAQGQRLGDKVRDLRGPWVKAKESRCYNGDGSWSGEIDEPLSNLLRQIAGLLEWADAHMPKRAEEVTALLRRLDPHSCPLPPRLEDLNAAYWMAMYDFFNKVTHGSEQTPENFVMWVRALERFLLDRLQPRAAADFDAIDAIVKEGQG